MGVLGNEFLDFIEGDEVRTELPLRGKELGRMSR